MDAGSLWLNPEEVFELTARKRWSAQCRALASMGVPFKPNAVGRPLVVRELVLPRPSSHKKKVTPDWDAMSGKTTH